MVVFIDPTCGAGEFLLSMLNIKIDLLELHKYEISNSDIKRVISTIYGNDINNDSITITKLRLFLCLLKRLGSNKISGIANIINKNFYNVDYVIKSNKIDRESDKVDINGKTIVPFSTHGGSGLSGFDSKLKRLYPNAKVLKGLAITGTDTQSRKDKVKNEVEKWLDEIVQ